MASKFSSSELELTSREASSSVQPSRENMPRKLSRRMFSLASMGMMALLPLTKQAQMHSLFYAQESFQDEPDIISTLDVFKSVATLEERRKGEKCVSMKSWQELSFPTCNTIHEIGFEEMELLGLGGWRGTWRVNTTDETVALKTLRVEENFGQDELTRHVVDAVTAERLTASPHIVNIYGYCGNSVMNEIAKTTLDKYMRRYETTKRQKLWLAREVALGLADLHDFEGNTTIVHRDIRPWNVLLIERNGGVQVKIHDFNDSEFLKRNRKNNSTCGFRRGRRGSPQYGAPEDVKWKKLSEKVDVYALGSVIFFILTGGRHPYKMEGIPDSEAFRRIKKGIRPELPTRIERSTDPAYIALKDAIWKCQEYQPDMRASARTIANELTAALEALD